MAVTETLRTLKKTMLKVNLSLKTAEIIVSNLRTQEQQQEMIDYLMKWEDIITDHQAIQHINKIIHKKNNA